jgi:hypothetical protein
LQEFENFQPITTTHSFCEISVQHVSWWELENIAIEQSLLQFTEKGGNGCVIHGSVDKLS